MLEHSQKPTQADDMVIDLVSDDETPAVVVTSPKGKGKQVDEVMFPGLVDSAAEPSAVLKLSGDMEVEENLYDADA